jgi:hypothetical protein
MSRPVWTILVKLHARNIQEEIIKFDPVISEKKLFMFNWRLDALTEDEGGDKLWSQKFTLSTLCPGEQKSLLDKK